MHSEDKNLENVFIYVEKEKLRLRRENNSYKREHNFSKVRGRRRSSLCEGLRKRQGK